MIAFDLETHLFGMGIMAPTPICLSWANDKGDHGLLGKDDISSWIKMALLSNEIITGHYVAFDFSCVLAHCPELSSLAWKAYSNDRITCTAIRDRLIDIAKGKFRGRQYSLAAVAKRRLGIDMNKGDDTWRKRYKELENIPLIDWPKDAVSYSVNDAIYTQQIFEQQEISAQLIPTQYEDTRADLALRMAAVWGFATDQAKVSSLRQSMTDEMRALRPGIVQSGIAVANKDGSISKKLKGIRERIATSYPGTPPKTPKGSIKTSSEVLEKCGLPEFDKVVKHEKLQKVVNTYLSKLVPIVHARFNAVGAASDRTSCNSPNLQNQPRAPGVRECFVARPGTVLIACDYDAQEMRTLAQTCLDICGKSKLAERFQDDPHFDPHLEFAARLGNIPIAQAKDRLANHDKEIKSLRQRSKAANFGYPGGMGPEAFISYAAGYGVILTSDQSKALKDMWFQQWPEMQVYFRHVSSIVSGGYGVQKIPRSGFTRAGVGYCDTANGYFQTLAAHASKHAMYEVTKKCFVNRQSYLYGSRPVAFIHDEIILEAPEFAVQEIAKDLEQTMVNSMQLWTPDIPISASATAMYAWSKAAEPTFNNGRLVPWQID